MTDIFILLATGVFGFLASAWKGDAWYDIVFKLGLTGCAIIGAICSAAVLGLTP